MDHPDLLGQRQVDFALRPIRLAYLVRKGSVDHFRRAVDEASSRWGGITELIIPFNDEGVPDPYWLSALELAQPDYFAIPDSVRVDIRAAISDRLHRELTPLSFFNRGPYGLHQLAVHAPSSLVNSVLMAGTAGSEPCHAAAFGSVMLNTQRRAWQAAGVTLAGPSNWRSTAQAQIAGTTIIDATRHQLSELPGSQWISTPALIWVTSGSRSLDDAIAFWNHRAMMPVRLQRPMVAIVSPSALRLAEVVTAIDRRIRETPWRSKPDVLLYSATVNNSTLKELIDSVGWTLYRRRKASFSFSSVAKNPGRRRISAGVGWDPAIFLGSDREIGARTRTFVQFERPATLVSSDSPVAFSGLAGGGIRARFSGPDELSMPPGNSIARMFHPAAIRVGQNLEIQTDAQASYDFLLQVPERPELLKASLIEHQCEYSLSDKGRYAMGVSRLLGDLEVLGGRLAVPVIRALTTRRIEYDMQALVRRFPETPPEHLDEIARSLQDVRQLDLPLAAIAGRAKATGKDAGPVIDELVTRGVVVRGLRVYCQTCGYRSFLTLSDARPRATCPACLAQAEFIGEIEPTFHYRLNAMVDRASDNGVLVHLLVWAQLLRIDAKAWVLPGVNLKLDKRGTEVDILALLGSTIWFGEAKTSAVDFKSEEVGLDLSIASQIEATNYVLACLEPIPEAVTQTAISIGTTKNISIWTLEGLDSELVKRKL